MHDVDRTNTAGGAQLSEAQRTMLVRLPPACANDTASAAPSAELPTIADQQVSSVIAVVCRCNGTWIERCGTCHPPCSHCLLRYSSCGGSSVFVGQCRAGGSLQTHGGSIAAVDVDHPCGHWIHAVSAATCK